MKKRMAFGEGLFYVLATLCTLTLLGLLVWQELGQ